MVAVAATVATTAATTATAATRALTITGFVHVERTPIELGTVHVLHGRICIAIIVKRDEPETAAAARVTIRDDLGVGDFTELLERCPQGLIVRAPAQTTDKKLL